jgi:S-DNA-T family DNA segregation ATPase FtsK/SpoIIIE
MAKKQSRKSSRRKKSPKKSIFSLSRQQKILLGSFLFFFGLALAISFISYLLTWQADQSTIGVLDERELQTENWLNKFGTQMGHMFVYKGFGIASLIPAILLTLTGLYYFFDSDKNTLWGKWFWGLLTMLWLSICLGFFTASGGLLSGVIGFELNDLLQDYLGMIGAIFLMTFLLIVYLVVRLKLTPEIVGRFYKKSKEDLASEFVDPDESGQLSTEPVDTGSDASPTDEVRMTEEAAIETELSSEPTTIPEEEDEETMMEQMVLKKVEAVAEPVADPEVKMEVEAAEEEEEIDKLSKKLVEDFGEFDPTLELGKYRFPTLDLLKNYEGSTGITIDQEELEENKNRIVNTLSNYKIGISNIKATVGPTVTLYEIVPEAGIRISKIKNLEDDIALSLSALGIRIIAPIPGRGTIGIEVPNKKPRIVSMRSVIASTKFQDAEMELPLALGKTISNETFVVDLAKMPHLLMAGATGQGKSVGLNAILTSLLYKKHPAEVKFVLVDPKKVELTLFNKIERHYLAKLPDSEEAIITDTHKVINTLNSLCIEMDARYDLLKDAMCRNIKEYNRKFKARKLNPNDGHRYLPYIVLVIDEFADLIMTAGKEVETPIARLAQLARAIGIHLIIATQRPSVNVITGIIKANFPARIAFRVTSKIDSRTILDGPGADQLIGRGDMLYTQGNDMIRLQCAFVDTPEVSDITEFIGSQKAYPDAHLLPEYVGEESGTNLDITADERDALFREAAEVLVIAQQGSTSLLQRKLKLGYNRAGRIIDQLEAAGIIGPFEGSKARQVLVPTVEALNQLLANENENTP